MTQFDIALRAGYLEINQWKRCRQNLSSGLTLEAVKDNTERVLKRRHWGAVQGGRIFERLHRFSSSWTQIFEL